MENGVNFPLHSPLYNTENDDLCYLLSHMGKTRNGIVVLRSNLLLVIPKIISLSSLLSLLDSTKHDTVI